MHPLADTTVVELAGQGGAPVRLAIGMAGRIAASLGAHVVSIERTASSEHEADRGTSDFLAAGKKIEVWPSDTAAMRAALLTAAARGNAIAIGAEDCAALGLASELGLASVAVADWPRSAPRRVLSEFTALAASGLLHMIGAPEREPLRLGGHQSAYPAGLAAFSAIMAVRAELDRGIRPTPARVSVVETLLWVNWKAVCGAVAEGVSPIRLGAGSEYQVMACRDGHVAVVFTVTQFGALQDLIGEPALADPKFATRALRSKHIGEFNDIIARWCADKTRAEIYARAQAKGVPIGPVFTPRELLEDPQFLARRFMTEAPGGGRMPAIPVLWNGVRPDGASSRGPSSDAARAVPGGRVRSDGPIGDMRPLAGIRVVDFGQLTAGANTSAMLADLGADVVKIESVGFVDLFRTIGKPDDLPGWWNRSPQFRFTNRNKLGLALDLKLEDGRRLVKELIKRSDVVVENFRRGVLERLGLDYASLNAINPKIVLASVSSQGETGPNRLHASFGSTLDATAGLAAVTGYEGGPPTISGMDVNYPDQVVSLIACGMVIAAVRAAKATGEGVHLDLAQREIASFLIGGEVLSASRGSSAGDSALRSGNAQAGFVLQDCFRCSDGRWLAISIETSAGAQAVSEYIAATGELRDDLAAWCAARAVAAADDAMCDLGLRTPGVSVMPVLDGLDLARERTLAGASLAWSSDGTMVKGMPYTFGGRGLAIDRMAPDLGQHSDVILREWLGLDATEIARLKAAGVTRDTL